MKKSVQLQSSHCCHYIDEKTEVQIIIGNTRCSCSFPSPPGCFSSYILYPISLLIHLGVMVLWLSAVVEWRIGILYHALNLRRGSNVSPRDSQNGSGERSLQWQVPDQKFWAQTYLYPSDCEAALLFFPPPNSALPSF